MAMDGAYTLDLRQPVLLCGSCDDLVISIRPANIIINIVALFLRR